jgi:hypothetical protein
MILSTLWITLVTSLCHAVVHLWMNVGVIRPLRCDAQFFVYLKIELTKNDAFSSSWMGIVGHRTSPWARDALLLEPLQTVSPLDTSAASLWA